MAEHTEVVAVTGASAGLGRAIVREFARHGAHLGLMARGPAALEAAREEAEKLGVRAVTRSVDVSDAAGVEAAAAAFESELGPIDIWINNAMTSVFSPFWEMTPEEFRRVTEVTYLGYVHGTMAALRRMLPRNRGVIVQVGSALAYRGIPLQSAYCGAKHAIRGFTDSLRSELIHDASLVRLVMVQMPALNTPQFNWVKSRMPRKPQPVPPIFQPEVGARAVYYAAHSTRREMYVGGSTVQAIVGNKIIPGWLDHYLAGRGWEGQQYDGPPEPDRPVNLWDPVPGDFGARGDFDTRAARCSLQLWASMHRGALAAAGLAGLALIALFRPKA